jgi:hypothetical protein
MPNLRTLKLSSTEAIVKVDGAVGAQIINLSTDLKLGSEVANSPKVNILSMIVTGATGGSAIISRNAVNLYHLQANVGQPMDLIAFGGVSDSTLNDQNITVTTSGAETQVILKLRKLSGYQSMVQPAEYGIYDNTGSTTS